MQVVTYHVIITFGNMELNIKGGTTCVHTHKIIVHGPY